MRAPFSGCQAKGKPVARASRSNTAGWSKNRMCSVVMAKSCIDTGAGRRMGSVCHQLTGRVEAVVDELGGVPPVREGVQLAGDGVDLGVGGHPVGQGVAGVGAAQGVELGRQLVGVAALGEGEDAPGEGQHVGVAGVVGGLGRAADRGLAQGGGDGVGAHPAVAVGHGPPSLQLEAVDHPVTGEPVVGAGDLGPGVGAGAQVAAAQRLGQAPVGDEVVAGDLVVHGGEVAAQERVGLLLGGLGGRHGAPPRRDDPGAAGRWVLLLHCGVRPGPVSCRRQVRTAPHSCQ